MLERFKKALAATGEKGPSPVLVGAICLFIGLAIGYTWASPDR